MCAYCVDDSYHNTIYLLKNSAKEFVTFNEHRRQYFGQY